MHASGTDITLAVIAGGRGRRMGGPKALLRVGDRSIFAWLLDRLNWPGPTMLVTAPSIANPPDAGLFHQHVVDPTDDEGPLRGLLTALENAATERVVAVPVDMPNLDREKLQWLAEQLPAEGLGLMCRNGSGEVEPFPFVLRRAALPVIQRRLQSGQRALHRLCDEPGFKTIAVNWPDEIWANVNEPSDLRFFP